MSLLRLVISTYAIIASCQASGIGHLVPAIKTIPIVRYAPFYNFPNAVRSIHAVAPPVQAVTPALPAPAPLLPAPLAAPLPPPALPAPFLPAPAFASVPALPAPAFAPAPAFSTPSFVPAPTPVFAPAPAFRVVAQTPHVIAPVLPKIAPAVPALPPVPVVGPTQFFRAEPSLPAVPFSPIVRPVATALPSPYFTPAIAPAPVSVARAPIALPYASHFPHYARYFSPAPIFPASVVKQVAWK